MTLRMQFFFTMFLVAAVAAGAVAWYASVAAGVALHGHDAYPSAAPPMPAPLRAVVASLQDAAAAGSLPPHVVLPAPVAESWRLVVAAADGTVVSSSSPAYLGLRVYPGAAMITIASRATTAGPGLRNSVAVHMVREAPLVDARGRALGTAIFLPTVHGTQELIAARAQERLNRLIAVGALVALVAAALASALLSAQLVRPLRALATASAAMAAGDLGVRVPPARAAEVRDVARAFNGMAARLERTERLRAEMANDIAHELRTPLNNLYGQLESIEANVIAASPERIRALKDETARLGELVADLQQLTLAEDDTRSVDREPVAPSEFLRVIALKYDGIARAAGVAIRVECADDVPLVSADVRSLRHVMVNLIGNAVRHTPRGGAVVLSAQPDGDGTIAFSVVDDGTGIPPGLLADVFERFYRAGTARDTGGSGLGLAIAKRLVEANGGAIRAENVEPHGARITFTMARY